MLTVLRSRQTMHDSFGNEDNRAVNTISKQVLKRLEGPWRSGYNATTSNISIHHSICLHIILLLFHMLFDAQVKSLSGG